jgi:hypothetical protein
MAEKEKNYQRRVIDSRGAHFRIDTGNPTESLTGPEVCKVYAVNDNDEVFLISHSNGGLTRIAVDKTLEVRAGDKNPVGVNDIRISAANGSIAINADYGNVLVKAKNIMIQSTQDIDIAAGRNVNITAGARIALTANTVANNGKRGNMIANTFGMKMFAGSFVPGDLVESALGPFSSPTILGLGKAAFGAATGGNLGGFVANSVISSTGIGGVAGGAVKSALGGFF